MRPVPASKPVAFVTGTVLLAITDFSCSPSQVGCCCLSIAASPATCGVAIDVPLIVVYASSTIGPSSVPAARAAVTSTPGATTSGLIAPLRKRGPRLENPAITLSMSTAPTVRAASAAPGEVTVEGPLLPLLPAAMTNKLSDDAESSSTARESGWVPSSVSPPRLMLTMSAPWSTAQTMPASTQESSP